jgi:hypothetical protein
VFVEKKKFRYVIFFTRYVDECLYMQMDGKEDGAKSEGCVQHGFDELTVPHCHGLAVSHWHGPTVSHWQLEDVWRNLGFRDLLCGIERVCRHWHMLSSERGIGWRDTSFRVVTDSNTERLRDQQHGTRNLPQLDMSEEPACRWWRQQQALTVPQLMALGPRMARVTGHLTLQLDCLPSDAIYYEKYLGRVSQICLVGAFFHADYLQRLVAAHTRSGRRPLKRLSVRTLGTADIEQILCVPHLQHLTLDTRFQYDTSALNKNGVPISTKTSISSIVKTCDAKETIVSSPLSPTLRSLHVHGNDTDIPSAFIIRIARLTALETLALRSLSLVLEDQSWRPSAVGDLSPLAHLMQLRVLHLGVPVPETFARTCVALPLHTLVLDFGFRCDLASPPDATATLSPDTIQRHVQRCVPPRYDDYFLNRDTDVPPFRARHVEAGTYVRRCMDRTLEVQNWWKGVPKRPGEGNSLWREMTIFGTNNIGRQTVTDRANNSVRVEVALPISILQTSWSLRSSTTLRTLHVYEQSWALGNFDWMLPPTLTALRLHRTNLFAGLMEDTGDFRGVRVVELCRDGLGSAIDTLLALTSFDTHTHPIGDAASGSPLNVGDEALLNRWSLPQALRGVQRRLV